MNRIPPLLLFVLINVHSGSAFADCDIAETSAAENHLFSLSYSAHPGSAPVDDNLTSFTLEDPPPDPANADEPPDPETGSRDLDDPEDREIIDKVINVIPLVNQFKINNTFIGETHNARGTSDALLLTGIGAFRLKDNMFLVTRLVAPILWQPDFDAPIGRTAGLGDTTMLSALAFETDWGKWGVGPAFVFPTASDYTLGEGQWQAGPGLAISYEKLPNLTFGLLAYNTFSFATNRHGKPSVSKLYFRPMVDYHFGDGWYTGIGDLLWVFNWKNGESYIPLSLRVGRAFRTAGLPLNIFVQPFYTVAHAELTPEWGVTVSVSVIFPAVGR